MRLRASTSNTPSELVELREAEAFSVLDHHDGGLGYINADFDYSGRNKDIKLSAGKFAHSLVFCLSFHLSMDKANTITEATF